MEVVRDEVPDVAPDLDTNPLVRYDAERRRVADVISGYAARDTADDDMPVPTECLGDELEEAYELPANLKAGRLARLVDSHPWQIVLAVALVSVLCSVWVVLTPGERFSTNEDLFIAKTNPAVADFYVLRRLPQYALHETSDTWTRNMNRRLEADEGHPSSPAPPLAWREAVTLVYERRGIDNGPKVLSLRQVKAIHDLEHTILQWARDHRACWTASVAEDAPCLPFDSMINFLYPTVKGEAESSERALVFDARMDAEVGGCSLPPFGEEDVIDTMVWLQNRSLASFLPPTAENGARYLRSTVYLNGKQMTSKLWYELAEMLFQSSVSLVHRSWYLKTYYGGPDSMTTAELLVSLTNDLYLLLFAVLAIGVYMRFYFGQWRLATLAALQILLSFPLMYWFVCVPMGQVPLSAFAAASLWVVVGVSADNIFVFHETWVQSRMLTRRGIAAPTSLRLEWSLRQAAPPLLFANGTTAISLLVNCLSPITSILQFGLCGGALIFVNFSLSLLYFPALLVLEAAREHRDTEAAEDRAKKNAARASRLRWLQDLHRDLWDNRLALLAGFGAVVLLATPLALSLAPSSDSSFTFAPDPQMTAIVERANKLPPEGLFLGAPGANYSNSAPLSLPLSSEGAGFLTAPARYFQLLHGSYHPPDAVSTGYTYGIWLCLFLLFDCPLFVALACVVHSGVPFFMLAPPEDSLVPSSLIFGIGLGGCLAGLTGLMEGAFTIFLCDFAMELQVVLGEVLGVLLLLHSYLFGKSAQVVHSERRWFVLRPTATTSRHREQWAMAFVALSAVCGVCGVLVLFSVNPFSLHGFQLPGFGWGWVAWGPAGMTFWLSLLCIYDGGLLSMAAHAASTGESETYFYPRPEYLKRLVAGAASFSLLGFCLLIVSGTPVGRAMPPQVGDALGLLCLANCAAHVATGYVIYTNRPWGVLQPTDFSERRRDVALGGQCVGALAFAVLACIAFASAHNPLPCDSDADARLTLAEYQHCIDLSALARLFEHIHFASPQVVALGLLLGVIWLCDARVCSIAARVLRSRKPAGVLQPLDASRAQPSGRELAWLRRLRLAATLLRLLGGFTLAVTLSPPLFATFFGSNGIVAINLLALTLLCHSPLFAALSRVFATAKPIFMLRPTDLSRRSSLPEWLAAAASLSCLVSGVVLLIVYDGLPGLPAWHGIDAHGFLLFLLLMADGAVCIHAAVSQYHEQSTFILRPLPDSSPPELLRLGERLATAGGAFQWLGVLALLLALNRAAANEAFGHARALEILLELLLAAHGVPLCFLSYAMRYNVSLGIFDAPSDPYAAASVGRGLQVLGLAAVALAVGFPLLDGGFWWETFGMVLFVFFLAGVILTHGMYAGDVVAEALERHNVSARRVRRLSFGITALAATLMGASFAFATFPAGSIVLKFAFFVPLQYYLMVAMCAFCFLNFFPIAATMETWYTDDSICGFAAEDAPTGRAKVPSAFALLCGAMACCAVGGALLATVGVIVRLDDKAAFEHGVLAEAPLDQAELCDFFFGVHTRCADAVLVDGFHPERQETQLKLLEACEQLASSPISPLHSAARAGPDGPVCVVARLQQYVTNGAGAAKGLHWPLEEKDFGPTMWDLLQSDATLRRENLVGFSDDSHAKVTWLRLTNLRAKHASRGVGAIELLAKPLTLMSYKTEWDQFASNLTAAGGGIGRATHTCAKWSALATELEFFTSVGRAVTLTPFCSMAAIALFSKSFIVSYAAFYTLVAMVLVLMGLMHMLAIPLGVTAALALSLVIGMSVDYIIHLAHAYNHSIFNDRFFKSRAAVFARASSIASSAITTLAAVAPLLVAQLLPLREFGQIFALVTCVSLFFSVGFLCALMLIGPRQTRKDGGPEAVPMTDRNDGAERSHWERVDDLSEGLQGRRDADASNMPSRQEDTDDSGWRRSTMLAGLAAQDGGDDAEDSADGGYDTRPLEGLPSEDAGRTLANSQSAPSNPNAVVRTTPPPNPHVDEEQEELL